MDEEYTDMTEELEEQFGSSEEEEETGSQLLAGKYKSVEELERAYREAEAAKTRAEQEAAQYRQYYQQAGAQTTATDDDDPNSAWFENPTEMAYRTYAQLRAMEKAANANRKRLISKFKRDPLWGEVAEEFEARLEELDDQVLADPTALDNVGEYIYDMVCGRIVRTKHSAQSSTDELKQRVQSASIESPFPSAELSSTTPPKGARRLLDQLFPDDPKAQREIMESYKRRIK